MTTSLILNQPAQLVPSRIIFSKHDNLVKKIVEIPKCRLFDVFTAHKITSHFDYVEWRIPYIAVLKLHHLLFYDAVLESDPFTVNSTFQLQCIFRFNEQEGIGIFLKHLDGVKLNNIVEISTCHLRKQAMFELNTFDVPKGFYFGLINSMHDNDLVVQFCFK
jgi:hypothetical protein